MPTSSPQTLTDRLQAERLNTHPTLEGGEELQRDNLAPNQRFIDIDEFGDAEGYPVELPPEATPTTGFHFYASAVGKHSLRKQTGVPRALDASGWDMTEPYLSEGTMPVGNPKIAAFGNYRPPAPIVVSVPGGKAGYEAGARELFITRVSRSGRHTLPSESVAFTLTSGQGFVGTLPDAISGGPRIGWWLTAPGGGRDTARLQKITLSSSRTVRFAGPYSGGRRLPSRNETELGAPTRVRYGKQGMVYQGPAPGSLHPGNYRFTWAKRTAFGVSRAAPWSDVVSVAGITGTDEQGNPITLPVPGTAFIVRKPRKERDMVGWILYVQKDGVSYRVEGTGALGDEASYLGFGPLPVRIYGDTSQEGARTNLVLAQEEPPIENTSGIEAPSGAPEEIAPFQASTSLAAPGTRRYAYAEAVEDGRGVEKVSLPSEGVRHTTAAGEYPRVIPPDPANIFPNAEGRERGSDGIPLNVTVGGINGRYLFPGGKHAITTDGAAYASDTARMDFAAREVDTSLTYCFRGVLEAEIVAGSARVTLLEYDGAGALIGTGRTLKEVASSGSTPFEVRLGPNGDSPWAAGTVSVAMRLHMSGTTRNMTARAYHLAGHPYPMAPRKVVSGGPYEVADFDPSPERPFPRGVVAAVGPAPTTSGTVDPTPPLADLNFNESATLTETGWTHSAPGIVSQIETISGRRVWRLHDATRDTARHGYMSYSTTARSSLAGRFRERIVKMPDPSGNWVEKVRIEGGAGFYLGSVRFFSENGVRLEAQDTNGVRREEGPYTGVYTDDELDYELIASGVGTKDGTLTLLLGRGGSQREVVGQISGIDWRTRAAATVRFGVSRGESNPNTTWQFYGHRITVTESGAPIGEAAKPPAGESAVPPDRPTRSYPAWAASTAYAVGAERVPTASNGHYYRVTVAGTSGTAEPAWPIASGDTVTDGTVTWQEAGGIYIDTDEDGETINQLYLFVPSYYANRRFDIDNVARFAVIPGQAYTFAVRGRHTVPAGLTGSRPFFLTLYNPETGEERDVGSPYGSGAAGRAAWADRTVAPFTPEEGFTELRAHFRNMGPGLYLFQDVALTKGNSVVRGYGCAATGWVRQVLKGETPYIAPVHPRLDRGWREIGSASDVPAGTDVVATFQYRNDAGTWVTFDPSAGMPDAVYGAVRLDLSGNGRKTPYVPKGSPYLSWSRVLPTLCRESGASFVGGSIVDGITVPVGRPEYVSDTAGGHNIHTDTTNIVGRIREGFTVGFFDEADARLFAERCLEERWTLEVPMHGGSVAGMRYVIDIDEVVEAPQFEDVPSYIFDGHHAAWVSVDVAGAEVLEETSLA